MAEAAPAEIAAPQAAPAAPQAGGADPIALGNQYKSEFESTLEGLRQRGTALQAQIQAQIEQGPAAIEPFKQELLSSVQDQSDVATPAAKVMQTFAWNTVLTAGLATGFFVGANLLGGLVHLVIGGFAAALLALGAAPAYTYQTIVSMKAAGAQDAELRMTLLAFAAGAGTLLGAVFSNTYFWSEPLAIITPLAVALTFAYGAPALGSARTSLLGASIGGAAGISLVLGVLTGSLSLSYLVLTTLYAGAAFVTLQFLFKNVKAEEESTHLYMLAFTVAILYAKGLSYALLGSSTPYESAAAAEK